MIRRCTKWHAACLRYWRSIALQLNSWDGWPHDPTVRVLSTSPSSGDHDHSCDRGGGAGAGRIRRRRTSAERGSREISRSASRRPMRVSRASSSTATARRLQTLAKRYGAKVLKTLRNGAVLQVTGGQLDALSQDADVDHLSGDVPVVRMAGEMTSAIGADQVWAGVLKRHVRVHGRGHRRRGGGLGDREVAAAQRPGGASPSTSLVASRSWTMTTAMERTWRGSSRVRARTIREWPRVRGS